MKTIKSLLTVAVLSVSATAFGQDLKSGFFNENYLYRHEVNPAIGNEKGYVAMPFILGNMSIGMGGNIGVKDMLFQRNGKTVTFMHPDVAKSDFKLSNNGKITEEFKYQLIGIGFKGIGGYNTIELNLRESMGVCLPGELFHMAKDGITNKTYDLSNLGATANAYVELGLGHSHQINDQWRVGGKFKLLVGAARADLIANKAEITLGQDNYSAVVDAELQANVKGIKFKGNSDDNFDGIDEIDGAGLGGFGVAFDLGAEYKLDDNWSFSLAFTDLGFINWNTNVVAKNDGSKVFNSKDYAFNVDEDAANNFDDTFEQMGDDLNEMLNLTNMGDTGSKTKGLGATMNIGASWRATFYDKLVFGLLNTTRIQGKYSWTDFRLSANVRPAKGFSATANISVGTYGVGFGWLLDFQAKKGIDFFIGMDHTMGKLAKQGVPLNSNAQFSMGLNFPF